MPALVDLIKSGRSKKNLSQQQVAEALGLKLRRYQYYEQGGVFPKPDLLRAIAAFLEFDMSEVDELKSSVKKSTTDWQARAIKLEQENKELKQLVKELRAEIKALKSGK